MTRGKSEPARLDSSTASAPPAVQVWRKARLRRLKRKLSLDFAKGPSVQNPQPLPAAAAQALVLFQNGWLAAAHDLCQSPELAHSAPARATLAQIYAQQAAE